MVLLQKYTLKEIAWNMQSRFSAGFSLCALGWLRSISSWDMFSDGVKKNRKENQQNLFDHPGPAGTTNKSQSDV